MKWDHYGVFYPSYKPTTVRLVKEEGYPKDISVYFPPVPGVNTYKIYGSLAPTIRTLIGEFTGSPPFRIKFPTSKVILPEELIVHTWVSYNKNGQEVFLQD